MFNRRRRPSEPPMTGYTRSTTERRRLRRINWPATISAASVLGIAATGLYFELQTNPARGAADHEAVVAKPSAVPGPPVPSRKTPEYSPPLSDHVPGDGMWLVGKQVKPGIYRSTAGASCYWERLSGLSGTYEDMLDNGGFRAGPQLIEILPGDFAFSSLHCGEWERVSDQ